MKNDFSDEVEDIMFALFKSSAPSLQEKEMEDETFLLTNIRSLVIIVVSLTAPAYHYSSDRGARHRISAKLFYVSKFNL